MQSFLSFAVLTCAALPCAAHACWDAAGRQYGISPALLFSVAQAESSLNPRAINRTHFHVTHTVDIGYMGINTNRAMLKNLGLTEVDLYNPCKNIHAGARILREKFQRFNVTWEAIGAYNASCAKLAPAACQEARRRYAWRVYGFLTNTRAPAVRRSPLAAKRNILNNARSERVVPVPAALVSVSLS
ncbi:lytic transglycosylase domain-containing protein [Janthinobacterium lividum]|uniref:lytic transglycosylase domain-containing protein n=1 Tax=Janthinobacterium lividum TaxID=29581 RepID=UPI001595F322|nr:lytic transglycosylase domain-containing protein [Janthinobacterium lividum]QKY12055.1 lytic transglycosylase domain-containing protein [Janthinobacterium lividum]